MSLSVALIAFFSILPALQVKKPEPVDAKQISEAVKKGVDFLLTQEKVALQSGVQGSSRLCARELVLWTLISAGASPKDPCYRNLFEDMLKDKLEATYSVALQAMILEFLDRARFQVRIAKCAQTLVDNQSQYGQWGYGSSSIYAEDEAYVGKPAGKANAKPSFAPPDAPQNPKVTRKISIEKKRDGQGADTSNTFFALLGLRAVQDAGIVLESKVFDVSVKCWKDWRSGKGEDAGWSYDQWKTTPYPTGSASAVASLLLLGNLQGTSMKKDAIVLGGAQALAKAWNGGALVSLTGPGDPGLFQNYGYFAFEVAGVFLGQEKFGEHDWYAEGAKLLLDQQRPDGLWDTSGSIPPPAGKVQYVNSYLWDSCFAILFLTRGIKPLQEAVPAKKK